MTTPEPTPLQRAVISTPARATGALAAFRRLEVAGPAALACTVCLIVGLAIGAASGSGSAHAAPTATVTATATETYTAYPQIPVPAPTPTKAQPSVVPMGTAITTDQWKITVVSYSEKRPDDAWDGSGKHDVYAVLAVTNTGASGAAFKPMGYIVAADQDGNTAMARGYMLAGTEAQFTWDRNLAAGEVRTEGITFEVYDTAKALSAFVSYTPYSATQRPVAKVVLAGAAVGT